MVGLGICRAVVDLLPKERYANRGEGPHADFIFTRLDGSAYRIHVDSSSTNDSKPIYYPNYGPTEQIVSYRWQIFDAGQCFTFDYARTIPKTDTIKKRDAFNILQTTPDDFHWWMLAANLGSSTKRVIGAGLIKGHFVDRSQVHAKLRFDRQTAPIFTSS